MLGDLGIDARATVADDRAPALLDASFVSAIVDATSDAMTSVAKGAIKFL